MDLIRVTPPEVSTEPDADGYFRSRRKQLVNEWTLSRNAPVATRLGDEVYLVFRSARGGNFNELEVHNMVDGEFASGMTDFDDVSHIANFGLRRLEGVREERRREE